jgi:hypothetical protein
MTIMEKALEADLHSAIEAEDDIGIEAAYRRGADLVAGVLRTAGEIFRANGNSPVC